MEPSHRCLWIVLEGLDFDSFSRARSSGGLTVGVVSADTKASRLHFPLAAARVATLVSAMTGAWPDQHGIVTAQWRDSNGALRPIMGSDRALLTVWERLDRRGLPTIAVGWPAASGVTTRHASLVEAGFGFTTSPEPTPATDRWVFPPELAGPLAECWLRPDELDTSIIAALAPGWRTVNQDVDGRLASLALVLAENASRHAAFLELIAQGPWTLATLCLSLPAELASLQRLSEPLADGLFDGLCDRAWPLLSQFLAAIRRGVPADVNLVLAGLPHPERPSVHGFVCVEGPAFEGRAVDKQVSLLRMAPEVCRACGLDPAQEKSGVTGVVVDFRPLLKITQPILKKSGEVPTPVELWHYSALGVAAESHAARGDDLGSLPYWEALTRLAPNDFEKKLRFADVQRGLGLVSEALDTLYSAIHPQFRDDPRPFLAAAKVEVQLGNPNAARQLLRRADPVIGANRDARLQSAVIRMRLGEWQVAAGVFESLVAGKPDDPSAHFFLARCEIGRRRWHQALEHATRAAELGFSNARTFEIVAHALHGMGLRERAMEALETACAMAPDWPRPRAKRVLLAREMGESPERIEQLTQEYRAVRLKAQERRQARLAAARALE